MWLRISTFALCALLIAGCDSSPETEGTDSAATTGPPPTAAEPQPTPAPMTTTTTPPTTTITTTTTTPPNKAAPSTTTATVANLESGLFCRDLFPRGFDYEEAVAYWVREGSPDRMDADRNGIPCETVYPEAEVLAFWGEIPEPTTPPAALTMPVLEAYVGAEWQRAYGWTIDWTCRLEAGTPLTAGAVVSCVPTEIGEGEYPVTTALVLDDVGTVAVSEAGLRYPELNASFIIEALGTGLLCRDVLSEEGGLPEWVAGEELRYFGALLYWTMEGRPDRMDADRNGIPCETRVSAEVVRRVWNGGFVEGTPYP